MPQLRLTGSSPSPSSGVALPFVMQPAADAHDTPARPASTGSAGVLRAGVDWIVRVQRQVLGQQLVEAPVSVNKPTVRRR